MLNCKFKKNSIQSTYQIVDMIKKNLGNILEVPYGDFYELPCR